MVEGSATPYAKTQTKQYLDRAPGPFADLGSPFDQFGWTAIAVVSAVVGLCAAVGVEVFRDLVDGVVAGVLLGVPLAYASTLVEEPYLTQLEGFVQRRHRYGAAEPRPAVPARLTTVRALHPLAALWRRVATELAPAPSWRVLALAGGQRAAMACEPGGINVRADGALYALWRVEPINAVSLGDAALGRVLDLFGEIPQLLAHGQRVQIGIANRGVRAEDRARALAARQAGHTPATREYAPLRATWLAARAHRVSDRRMYIALEDKRPLPIQARLARVRRTLDLLEEGRRTEFAHRMAELTALIARMGLKATPLVGDDAERTIAGMVGAAARHDEEPPAAPERARPTPVSRTQAALAACDVTERLTHVEIGHAGPDPSAGPDTGAGPPVGEGTGTGTETGTRRYARTLYVLKPRRRTAPLWLMPLVALPGQSRLSIVIEGRTQEREEGRLERFAQRAHQYNETRAGSGLLAKARLSSSQREHQQTLEETEDPDIGIYRVGIALTVIADTPDDLRRATAHAKAAIRGVRCGVGNGIGDQLRLYLDTVTLAHSVSGHLFRATTPTLATLFPYNRENPGHPTGMPLGVTAAREEFLLDLDASDISTQQIFVCGVPNSGKSVLMNELALQSWLEGNGVTGIDRSGSYRPLCTFLGGTYLIPLDQEGERPALNAWEVYARSFSPEGRVTEMLRLHETMYGRGDASDRLTSWQYQQLAEAIAAVYARARGSQDTPYPLERELIAHLRAKMGGKLPVARRMELEDVIAGFQPYCAGGDFESLADRATDVDLLNRFLIFDTRHCKGKNAVVVYRIMEAVTELRAAVRATERRVDGRPALEMQLVDEGKSVLEVAAEQMGENTLRSRHKNRRFVFGTQFISHVADNPQVASLISAVPVVIICKTRDERAGQQAGNEWIGRTVGLTQREVDLLPGLEVDPGRHAQALVVVRALKGGNRSGVVNLEFAPWDIELFKSQPIEREERDATVRAHGGDLWAAVKITVQARLARQDGRARHAPVPH